MGVAGRDWLGDARDAVRLLRIETNLATMYRGTLLTRNRAPLGPFSRIMPGALWWPYGGGLFLMSEVPLQWSGWAGLVGKHTRGAVRF